MQFLVNIKSSICNDNEIRCIPPFWKNNLRGLTDLERCTTRTQLKRIYCHTKNYKSLLANLTSPCIDMYNFVGWNWNKRKDTMDLGQTVIKFLYLEKFYQEIRHSEEFGFESFISNLGGFVGIFLGYSLMQLPDLLGMATN